MNKAEFDRFADEYEAMHSASLAPSGEGPEYFAEYKIVDMAADYRRYCSVTGKAWRILDFGAGNGTSVPYVTRLFPDARLTCLDVSRRCLDIAEARYPGQAEFVEFDGAHVPAASDTYEIAYAACVFHHVDHAEHLSLLRELWRVIRPGGCLFVFEHNPLNPLTARIVDSCPFDANARLIRASEMQRRVAAAGFDWHAVNYRIFFPRVLRALRPLEKALRWCPLGGQYYVVARK